MTVQVIGALCIAVALIGGGLTIGKLVSIPSLTKWRVIALVVAGSALIALGLLTKENPPTLPITSSGTPAAEKASL